MSNVRIQPVMSPPGENATFITLNILPEQTHADAVLDFASGFTALIRSLHKRFPQSHFNVVLGIGSEAWDRLFPDQPKPKELNTFKEIKGPRHVAVATPADLFFHIRADSRDICYEMAALIELKIGQHTTAQDETHGFRYLDGRAIIGFVDGTENPEFVVAGEYALVGDEDPDFKNGSYAFAQKYLHNMQKWRALSTSEQENVIGRRKHDDIELSDDEKPKTAHNNVSKAHDADGNEMKILRANVAFAQPSNNEYGTYFIGYSRSLKVTYSMVNNMFTGNPEGFTDHLLDFSTPITGNAFFVPTYDFLDNIGSD